MTTQSTPPLSSDARERFLDRIRSALGDANVLSDGDLSAWEVDWRKRYRGKALAVALELLRNKILTAARAISSSATRRRAAWSSAVRTSRRCRRTSAT